MLCFKCKIELFYSVKWTQNMQFSSMDYYTLHGILPVVAFKVNLNVNIKGYRLEWRVRFWIPWKKTALYSSEHFEPKSALVLWKS